MSKTPTSFHFLIPNGMILDDFFTELEIFGEWEGCPTNWYLLFDDMAHAFFIFLILEILEGV